MNEKTVEVPLEDWVRAIIKDTATKTVEGAIQKHQDSCPLQTTNIMGNGKPSWDIRIDRLERAVKIALWVITPMYLTGAGVIVKEILQHFN